MVTYVNIKDGTLVMFWPITWQEPNHLTERRWARLTPEMRAAPLHYSFPMKKQAVYFLAYFFASALLQSQLSHAWKTLGLSQHVMCLRAGGSHFWCKLQPGERGTEQFQEVHPSNSLAPVSLLLCKPTKQTTSLLVLPSLQSKMWIKKE